MPGRSWSSIRRDDIDVVGKGKHGDIVREISPTIRFVRHAFTWVSIEEDRLELALQGVHVGSSAEWLWSRDHGVVIAYPP